MLSGSICRLNTRNALNFRSMGEPRRRVSCKGFSLPERSLELPSASAAHYKKDIGVIKAKIKESNGFFNVKSQERIEGQTGNYGKARVLEQEVRTLPVNLQSAEVRTDIQIRSMKLCFMESVGNARAGVHWEMKKTRELTRQELGPPETKGLIPGYHRKSLGGIRVSTRLKDLGTISLSKDASE